MLPVLSVLSFACLAAAGPHYNYNPPKGGAVAIHGIPVPTVAAPLAPFLAISHDAQKAVRPSLPLHHRIIPIAQPLPPHFAIRDVQVPVKPAEDSKPEPLITYPFSSVFVPHPPFLAIRDVQVPRVPVSEEEIEEDESEEVEDVPLTLPVAQGTLPPFLAVQHDAQTPIKADSGFLNNIFGFHTDTIYGPPLVDFGSIRPADPALTIDNDLPVPGGVAPSIGAIRNQQIPIRGPLVAVAEDQQELEDVEVVGADDKTSTSQESVMQGPRFVELIYFPEKIANIFVTRELNPDNEVHAPAGIVQSTQPIFFLRPFVNSKAHESIRSFTNSKAHPDTHKGPNEESVAIIF